jgi:hypothetical protein
MGYLNVYRYAAMLRACCSLMAMAGIAVCGDIAGASYIQRANISGVFGNLPAM